MNAPETRGAAIIRVIDAHKAGQISEHEAEAYLRTTHDITLEKARRLVDPRLETYDRRNRVVAITSSLLLLFLIAAVVMNVGDTPTGFATLTFSEQATSDSSYPIAGEITQLRVSGTLTGEGSATLWLDTIEGTRLLIGTVTSDPGTPRTAKASYTPGDGVEIEHLPQDATVYLDDGTTTTVTSVPFPAPDTSAEILIVANESGELTTYRLPIVIGDAPRTTTFSDLCEQTCTISATQGNLTIDITDGATIEIVANADTPEPNHAPVVAVPFSPTTVDGPITIDLGSHIVDSDGDDLLYSVGITDLVDAQISGDVLTLTPLRSGTIDLPIYASDLTELISTSVSLVVVAQESNETTNESVDPTPPIEINDTIDVPIENQTNTTNDTIAINVTGPLDCSSTNPNDLPVECLLANPTEYFPEEDIYLENLDRVKVAKLNMVGNLLLTGDVYQYSANLPGSRDFTVGEPDRDGNIIVSAWIDSATGDLHLRGRLIEEEVSVNPPAGSYSILTKRSIYLAYVDLATGDLHLRGNVIPYRRSIE